MKRNTSSSAKWPPSEPAAAAEATSSKNILSLLRAREIGATVHLANHRLGADTRGRLDESFNRISSSIAELSDAIDRHDSAEIERAVAQMLNRMVDPAGTESSYDITPQRKQEREMFTALGGLHVLTALIEPPLAELDARKMDRNVIETKVEYWNEVLVLLREICYSVPSLADNVFTDQHIAFFFTMLSHKVAFENTMNVIEEILAVKVDTFDLNLVPNLYKLLDGFNPRQLMYVHHILFYSSRECLVTISRRHFCRILALVLFESEDRQIMECAQVLRSLDLLQLRRDRMAKGTNIVERNQSLIVEMPQLLDKFLVLFRVVNYGPALSKLVRHHVIAQAPGDIFQYSPVSSSGGPPRGEWELLKFLDDSVRSSGTSLGRRSGNALDPADAEVMDQLLAAFSPPADPSAAMPAMMGSIFAILEVASALGVASFSNFNYTAFGVPALVQRNRAHYTYREAKNLLQFQAMLLVPHQVELLFVLCTLLSGRWKIEMQDRLADLGIVECFYDMYDRLSWGEDPLYGLNNPAPEHIHGPSCECSPESAIRVQYLRLVHNFYDRDFIDNPNKNLLLSPAEISLIQNHPERLISGKYCLQPSESGL